MTEEVTFTPEDVEAAQRMLARLDPADDAYALATAAGVHRSDVHDRARVRDFHAGMLYGREQKGTETMHHAADAFSLRDKVATLQSENAELMRKGQDLCQWIGCTLTELRVSTPEAAAVELERRRVEAASLKATVQRLNRRAQKAESELAKERRTPKGVDTWSSAERQKEAAERDASMAAIAAAEERNDTQG